MKKILITILIIFIIVNIVAASDSVSFLNLEQNDFHWNVDENNLHIYRFDENKIFVRVLDEQFNTMSENEIYSCDEDILDIRYNNIAKYPAFTVSTENSTIVLDNLNKELRAFHFPKNTFIQYRNGKNIILITDDERKKVSSYCTNLKEITKTIELNTSVGFADDYVLMFRSEGLFAVRSLDFYDSNLSLIKTFTSTEIPELRKINLIGRDNMFLNATSVGNENYLSLNIQPKFRKGLLIFLPTCNYILNFSLRDDIKLLNKQKIKSEIFDFQNNRVLNVIDDKIINFQVSAKEGFGISVYDFKTNKTKRVSLDEMPVSGYLHFQENNSKRESILTLEFIDSIRFYDFDINTLDKRLIYTYTNKTDSDSFFYLNRIRHHNDTIYFEIGSTSQNNQIIKFR